MKEEKEIAAGCIGASGERHSSAADATIAAPRQDQPAPAMEDGADATMPKPSVRQAEGSSLRSRKKAQSRHAIERAMLELVLERGYENVTVEDVCQRAEVSKKTFFNYFPSKDAAIRGGFDAIPTSDDFLAAFEADASETYLDCAVRLAQSSMADGYRNSDLRELRRKVFSMSPQLLFRGHKDIAEMQANITCALKALLTAHPERRLLPDESLAMELLVATSAVASLMRIRLVASVRERGVMEPSDARRLIAHLVEKGL